MFSAIGRSLTSGESCFITEAQGRVIRKAGDRTRSARQDRPAHGRRGPQYRLNTGAFLACDGSVPMS